MEDFMKKKTKRLFVIFTLVFAAVALMSGCDMDGVMPKPFIPGGPGGGGSPDGRLPGGVPGPGVPSPDAPPVRSSYLTVFNLPPQTSRGHVSKVYVFNQVSKLGFCSSYDDIIIENNAETSTVKIPLVYFSDSGLRFDLNGSYFVSFDMNIDALTRLTVAEDDFFVLDFFDGGAVLDASLTQPPPPYLVLNSLPVNVRHLDFSNIAVYSSTGAAVAKCPDYFQIILTAGPDSASAKIPLVYNNRNERFADTGNFIVSFFINIDFETQVVLTKDDKLSLLFNKGNAVFDASLVPPPSYLTVTSLPKNVKHLDFSNVVVYASAGAAAAVCPDYFQIILSAGPDSASVKIPLVYNETNGRFSDTGNFIVSFSINIDSKTQIVLNKEDKFSLFFTKGNASLDASLVKPPPPSCLIVNSLPKNVKQADFSKVFVYDPSGSAVAECRDYLQIILSAGSDYASAEIPLVYRTNGARFRDSGRLAVSFSLNVPSFIKVERAKDDAFYVDFSEGSGAFSLPVELGFFSGGLANPSDTAAPVVGIGTVFEMNGSYYAVYSNTPPAPSNFPNTCIVYIYARPVSNQIQFFYSTAAPVYDNNKKGFYSGFDRALFMSVFIRDSQNKYFAKSSIKDGWPHLNYHTVDSHSLASQSLSNYYYLSGTGNPSQQVVTLPAGAYLITLSGSPGGLCIKSPTFTLFGGSGGFISEVVVLSKDTPFTFFTGEKGGNSENDSYYINSGGTVTQGRYESGAGGGSGSFAYSPDGYLLCAGGGGGAAGQSGSGGQSSPSWSSSSGGGAGGSIGGGGGRGCGGQREWGLCFWRGGRGF
jgi:hypothetical protein